MNNLFSNSSSLSPSIIKLWNSYSHFNQKIKRRSNVSFQTLKHIDIFATKIVIRNYNFYILYANMIEIWLFAKFPFSESTKNLFNDFDSFHKDDTSQ